MTPSYSMAMRATVRVSSLLSFPLPPGRTGDNAGVEHGCPSMGDRTEVGWRSSVEEDTFGCGCGPCGCAPVSGKCHHSYLNLPGKGAAMSLAGRRQVQEGEVQNTGWCGQPCQKDLCIQGMPGPTRPKSTLWLGTGRNWELGYIRKSGLQIKLCLLQVGPQLEWCPILGTLLKKDMEELERVLWQAAKVLSGVRRGCGGGFVSSGKEDPQGAPVAAYHAWKNGCRDIETQLTSGLPQSQQRSNSHEVRWDNLPREVADAPPGSLRCCYAKSWL